MDGNDMDQKNEYREPSLTDLLELINALDEICTKYKVSWDYLQQLTQLIDDFFVEGWNFPPMILTADQIVVG